MNPVLTDRIERLRNSGTYVHLSEALHGIEKEGLRVAPSGGISLSPHPAKLGSALTNRYITTDFAESLLEFITPVSTDPGAALHFLETIHQFVYTHLDDELLWASSMPCRIDDVSMIPIARYGTSNIGRMKHVYRVGLEHRYGKMMQSIAGIHYNFSLPETFWEAYRELSEVKDSLQAFTSSSYFAMIRNFRRSSWLLLFLFGASPALSRTFLEGDTQGFDTLLDDTLYLPYATSLRMSDLGYSNTTQSSINICFNQLKTYTKTLTEAINTSHPDFEEIGVIVDGAYRQLSTTILQIENEYYSDIRPKRVPGSEESALQALKRAGVEYVEVRNTDVNPLLPLGMDLEQALFLDTFLIGCLLMGDDFITQTECGIIAANQRKVTTRGREPQLHLSGRNGEIGIEEAGSDLLRQFALVAELLDHTNHTDIYGKAVQAQFEKLQDPSLTPSARILQALEGSGMEYTDWVLDVSRGHRETLVLSPQDATIFKQLSNESRESVVEQLEIEENDTVDFETFLAKYRIGPSND